MVSAIADDARTRRSELLLERLVGLLRQPPVWSLSLSRALSRALSLSLARSLARSARRQLKAEVARWQLKAYVSIRQHTPDGS